MLSSLPVFSDLKEKRSNWAFIKRTKINVKKINPGLEIKTGCKKEKSGCFTNNGSAPKNIAIAGVGKPMK